MPKSQTRFLLDTYFAAFNAGDTGKMEDLVADDLIHDVNQGERRVGKDKFWAEMSPKEQAAAKILGWDSVSIFSSS